MRDQNRLENELLELRAVADALDSSLRRLAAGDVHQQMDVPLPRFFDGMRKDFNRGLASVGTTIDGILDRTRELRSESAGLRDAMQRDADDEAKRSGTLAGLVAEFAVTEDGSRSQAAHADHIAAIVQNARLDMDRPKLAAFAIGKDAEQTCQTLADLKSLVDDAKTLVREASLIALNGGVNAAHAGEPGEEALGIAKNLHALTQQIGSTIDALGDVTEKALDTAGSAADTAGQLNREFDAMSLYLDAVDSQVRELGETARRQEKQVKSARADLASVARKARSVDGDGRTPAAHLDAMDRAAAEIEMLADRFTARPDIAPPSPSAPQPGRRSHLKLVKT